MNKNNNLLELSSISKIYKTGNRSVGVKNINLDVEKNEVIAVLGPSGCGKSTLLRLITGLTQADEGEIKFNGYPLERETHKEISMVFQNYALLPWMSVADNIALGFNLSMRNLSQENRDKVEEIMAMVGLSGFDKAYPSELSGGMCQRVGFARALITEPELLLLDEAFSALDALTAKKLRKDFMRLLRSDEIKTKSVLMVTHDVYEAVKIADRIVILSGSPCSIEYQIDNRDISSSNEYESIYHRRVKHIFDLLEDKKIDKPFMKNVVQFSGENEAC